MQADGPARGERWLSPSHLRASASASGHCFTVNPICNCICHRFDLTPIRRIKRRLRQQGETEPRSLGAQARVLLIPGSAHFPSPRLFLEFPYQDRASRLGTRGITFAWGDGCCTKSCHCRWRYNETADGGGVLSTVGAGSRASRSTAIVAVMCANCIRMKVNATFCSWKLTGYFIWLGRAPL